MEPTQDPRTPTHRDQGHDLLCTPGDAITHAVLDTAIAPFMRLKLEERRLDSHMANLSIVSVSRSG